jgi:hypothetical protein
MATINCSGFPTRDHRVTGQKEFDKRRKRSAIQTVAQPGLLIAFFCRIRCLQFTGKSANIRGELTLRIAAAGVLNVGPFLPLIE